MPAFDQRFDHHVRPQGNQMIIHSQFLKIPGIHNFSFAQSAVRLDAGSLVLLFKHLSRASTEKQSIVGGESFQPWIKRVPQSALPTT
jgi:hypothetical protein